MPDYIYLSDAFRALHKITKDSGAIFEYLQKGAFKAALRIDGNFKFLICIPESYWKDAGIDGIRQLRFPKEFRNQVFEIKVAAILPYLAPIFEKIETVQNEKSLNSIENLGFDEFFWEIEPRLSNKSKFDYYLETLAKIRMELFLKANTSIRPTFRMSDFEEIEKNAQSFYGVKTGRPSKSVLDDEFWIIVINNIVDGPFKKQKDVVSDVINRISASKLNKSHYSKTFVTNKLKQFWKDSKNILK